MDSADLFVQYEAVKKVIGEEGKTLLNAQGDASIPEFLTSYERMVKTFDGKNDLPSALNCGKYTALFWYDAAWSRKNVISSYEKMYNTQKGLLARAINLNWFALALIVLAWVAGYAFGVHHGIGR